VVQYLLKEKIGSMSKMEVMVILYVQEKHVLLKLVLTAGKANDAKHAGILLHQLTNFSEKRGCYSSQGGNSESMASFS